MPKRSEDVDALVASAPDHRGTTMTRLRELIHEADPEMIEAVKWRRPSNPLGSAVFEHDGIVCILVILKGRVRLGFNEGSKLPDPKGLFNAQLEGRSRAIDFREGDEIDASAIKAIIAAAVELNVAKAAAKAGGRPSTKARKS